MISVLLRFSTLVFNVVLQDFSFLFSADRYEEKEEYDDYAPETPAPLNPEDFTNSPVRTYLYFLPFERIIIALLVQFSRCFK